MVSKRGWCEMCRFQKCLYLILRMLPRRVTWFAEKSSSPLSPFQMFWWVCCSSNSKQKTIFNALNQINISSSMLVQSYFHALQMINQIGHIISVRPSLCVWSLTHQFQPQHQIIIIFSVGPEYKQNYIKVYRGHLGVSENQ